jgi:hypothetical protein
VAQRISGATISDWSARRFSWILLRRAIDERIGQMGSRMIMIAVHGRDQVSRRLAGTWSDRTPPALFERRRLTEWLIGVRTAADVAAFPSIANSSNLQLQLASHRYRYAFGHAR